MLELYEPEGAFEALEDYLAPFWGRDGVVADLYLGYGLSAALRRDGHPGPPEPCPLPLLACRVRSAAGPERVSTVGYELGEWERSWDDDGYAAAIEAVRAAIGRGDVYQANLVQHLSAPFAGDPWALALGLRHLHPLHPRPFVGHGWAVVSASPELFLARRGARLVTIADQGHAARRRRRRGREGRRRARDDRRPRAERPRARLRAGLGDLARADGPARARRASRTSSRPSRGRSDPASSLGEILAATFPGGSVTGAPKIAAVDLIAALEPVGRGASMGAVGTVRPDGDFELALTIRTLAVAEGRIHLWVGGGIVWDSDPEAEIEESWVKARPLLRAVGGLVPA